MKLALKIDVSTLRGLREGVPALVELLQTARRHAPRSSSPSAPTTPAARCCAPCPRAPPRAGRAARLRRELLRHGAARARPRASRRRRHAQRARRRPRDGPARLERRALAAPRSPRGSGVDGSGDAAGRGRATPASSASRPQSHAAAGWQTNVHALRMTQRLGFAYCSDGRGTLAPPARGKRRADPLPADSHHAAAARRVPRPAGRHARVARLAGAGAHGRLRAACPCSACAPRWKGSWPCACSSSC